MFTADPATLACNDTLFLFTGHDEDSATAEGFIMDYYLCFSTTDMVNWTQHGGQLSITPVQHRKLIETEKSVVNGRDTSFAEDFSTVRTKEIYLPAGSD